MNRRLARLLLLVPGAVMSLCAATGEPAMITAMEQPDTRPCRAELREMNEQIELFLDGEQAGRMWTRGGSDEGFKLEKYVRAGYRITLCSIGVNNGLFWDGEDYDYRALDRALEQVTSPDKDLKLLLYIGCQGSGPYKWNKANPDELAKLANGDSLCLASFASEKWLRDSSEAIRRLVRHVRSGPFKKNVIGYNLIQYSNEWHTPTTRNRPPLDDYSLPMQQYFRRWCRERYAGDPGRLNRAWGTAFESFDAVVIPAEERRLRTGLPALAFGEVDRWVSDYEECLDLAREHCIIAWCRAVKEASNGEALTSLSRTVKSLRLLNSEYLDICQGPYAYQDRKIAHLNQYALLNFALHRKMGILQIDAGTHVRPVNTGETPGANWIWNGPFRLTADAWESAELFERDVAHAIATNRYVYWLESGPGNMFPSPKLGAMTWGPTWADTPELTALMGRFKEIVEAHERMRTRSVAKVALVTTEFSTRREFDRLKLFRRDKVLRTLNRAGIAVDAYMLEDFASIRKPYDLYIFPDALIVPEALREQIRGKLAREKATALWLYGPGYYDGDGAAPANIEALCGIRVDAERREAPVQISVPSSPHRYLAGCASFGSRTAPVTNNDFLTFTRGDYVPETEVVNLPVRFHCVDPEATPLARFENEQSVGMAEKTGEFRSIWIGAPEAPWQVYANICEALGIHVYSRSGDTLFVNSGFVSLYSLSTGSKRIALPEPRLVRDAMTNEVVSAASREILFEARAGETRSFFLEYLPGVDAK